MSETILVGAVAYHPRIVTIWEGFRAWFDRRRDEADVKSNLPDRM